MHWIILATQPNGLFECEGFCSRSRYAGALYFTTTSVVHHSRSLIVLQGYTRFKLARSLEYNRMQSLACRGRQNRSFYSCATHYKYLRAAVGRASVNSHHRSQSLYGLGTPAALIASQDRCHCVTGPPPDTGLYKTARHPQAELGRHHPRWDCPPDRCQ
jgi:hypothetical protein